MAEARVAVEAKIAGTTVRVLRSDLEDEEAQNPNFFDEDFTVAAATGFTVWDGAWAMIELLKGWLGDEVRGKKTVEFGSGTGLAGLAAAAAGANVLLTDISSVTHDMLTPNINLNKVGESDNGAVWGEATPSYPIGSCNGTAAAATLDWTKPLPPHVVLGDVEVVIASEVVWLKELVDPFADALSGLLKQGGRGGSVVGYVVCRERANDGSQTFAHVTDVFEALQTRGCTVHKVSDQMGPDSQPTTTFKIMLC